MRRPVPDDWVDPLWVWHRGGVTPQPNPNRSQSEFLMPNCSSCQVNCNRRFLSCLIPSSARRPSWPLANFSGVVFCGFSAKQRLWVVSVGKVSVLFFVHNCSLSLWKTHNPPISFFLQVWNLMAAGADQRTALSFLSGLHVAEFADQSSANTCSNSNNYNFDRYWKRNNSFIMADFLNQLLSLLGCFCNGLIKWL